MSRLLFGFIITFCAFSASGQTYEITEIEMVGNITEIKGINNEGTDFSPYIINNKMYFTSNREFDLINVGENNWKKTGYLNIYMADYKGEINADTKFKDPVLMSKNLKSFNHTGPVCFSITGDTVFFTQVVKADKKNKSAKFIPQIYMATKDGNQWGNIQLLPFNDSRYSFGHPSYDSHKKRLYFAADIPGGKGKKDIYYSQYAAGIWSHPVSVEGVNTEADEVFPFIVDGILFFASNRSGGQGGLDIYWKNLNQVSDEVETVSGVNSNLDDFGVFIFQGIKNGYISSNRNGNDDIYFLNIEKKVTVRNELAGQFTYRNLSTSASNLKIQVVGEEDDILFETTTNELGQFYFRNLDYAGGYTIRAISEDDLNLVIYDKDGKPIIDLVSDENGNFSYKRLEYASSGIPNLIPDDMIDPISGLGHLSGQFVYEKIPGKYPKNMEVFLYDENGNIAFKQLTDQNGNFDFRQLSLSENYILKITESSDELVLLIFDKKGNVVAQLKSNPDGQFVYRKLSNEYQKPLALIEESEEVFELGTQTIAGYFQYNKLSGISPEGLTIFAYNDDGILLSQTQTDEKGEFRFRSLPTGTNLLFKIDENDPNLKLDDFTLFIYDRYGKKVAGLSRGQNGYFIYKPLGFDNHNNLSKLNEDSLDIELALVTNYDIVVVYFDSNRSDVKASDLNKLNKLVVFLKANPTIRMEINAYADARASDEYNLVLSKKRGDWIVDYMIKKGIPMSRFIVNAYGETQLVDETNDALNRRAEIRLY